MLRRIIVLGPPGSGKSTLSIAISKNYEIPCIHLDKEFWQPGYVKPNREHWYDRVALLSLRSAWVMDGEFLDTIEPRLARAELLIWLNPSRRKSLSGLLKRTYENYGCQRPDMASGCLDRISIEHLFRAAIYWNGLSGRTLGVYQKFSGYKLQIVRKIDPVSVINHIRTIAGAASQPRLG